MLGSNSGPTACRASTLLTELFPALYKSLSNEAPYASFSWRMPGGTNSLLPHTPSPCTSRIFHSVDADFEAEVIDYPHANMAFVYEERNQATFQKRSFQMLKPSSLKYMSQTSEIFISFKIPIVAKQHLCLANRLSILLGY